VLSKWWNGETTYPEESSASISNVVFDENSLVVHESDRLPDARVLDDFSDGDLVTAFREDWTPAWHGGEHPYTEISISRNSYGHHLVLKTLGGRDDTVGSSTLTTDLSGYSGVYLLASTGADIGITVQLWSRDQQWQSGNRATTASVQLVGSAEPQLIRLPFTSFEVDPSIYVCPRCCVDLDPSQITRLIIGSDQRAGLLCVYEIGFYQ